MRPLPKIIFRLFVALPLVACAKITVHEAAYTYVLQPDGTPKQVHYVVKSGFAMAEDDVILDTVEGAVQLRKAVESGAQFRSGFSSGAPDRKWPNGLVPYLIDKQLAEFEAASGQERLKNAIEALEAATGMRFIPQTHEHDFVVFERSSITGSHIGRRGGRQPLLISDQASMEFVMHELGHAVGLHHEHSRPDRDNFVTILWDNIDPANWYQFKTPMGDVQNQGAYDFNSIMHYDLFAFSRNGAPTMEVRSAGGKGEDKINLSNIGHPESFSEGDVTTIMDLLPSGCADLGAEGEGFNVRYRRNLGSKPDDAKVSAISVYSGVKQPSGGPGTVHVTVTKMHGAAELVLASVEPVNWILHTTRGARIRNIHLINSESTVSLEGLKDNLVKKKAYPTKMAGNGNAAGKKHAVGNAWREAGRTVDFLQTCLVGDSLITSRRSWKHDTDTLPPYQE